MSDIEAMEQVEDALADAGGIEQPATGEPNLLVDVDGFEGPLDVLLSLARSQKVDITKISILALTEQYLDFVREARRLRLELAADFLVMAAWLAYLKSRLLIPQQKDTDEPTGEELAAALAFRLQRLEAMREASARLMGRSRLGREVFARGAPETVSVERRSVWTATLYDLLMAYASQRQRNSVTSVYVKKRQVWSLQDAREILNRLVGQVAVWTPIERFLMVYLEDPQERTTVMASAFSASLELVREGVIDIQQSGPFETIYVRASQRTPDEAEAHESAATSQEKEVVLS
ncbi:Segregation and condensation protein A [Pseudovibrio axinellae]|uniref:Segregation and condensation protein A n=1 Tax=Pseudovibrio axinellae TaxID=989403 RepID=A0A165YQW8_9HYPH|nr:ScpA family protein [Pseudovibrio axinellae]KZL19137.1 Segregation and condensation protein A [Pseudovibrio axinellae]SER34460.1 condensin subunit ScpA [Pseudovibrio axinellae]